jgi:hypothetical protein
MEMEVYCDGGFAERAESAESRLQAVTEQWQTWRAKLLECWAKGYNATMTAMLESGPNVEGIQEDLRPR